MIEEFIVISRKRRYLDNGGPVKWGGTVIDFTFVIEATRTSIATKILQLEPSSTS